MEYHSFQNQVLLCVNTATNIKSQQNGNFSQYPQLYRWVLTLHKNAQSERIACETWRTDTVWYMKHNTTFSISTTRSWTRISTLLIDTGKMTCTLAVNNAFRSAAWWGTHISSQACTRWASISRHLTLCIGSTWRRLTGVTRLWWWNRCLCCPYEGRKM